MRFALIATTEQCGHLFHDARMNCVESRRITTSRATGYAVLQSPLPPLLRTDRPSSNRRVTYPRPSRSIGSMHRRGPSNDHPSSLSSEPLRFPHAALSFVQPRAIAISLALNRSRVSSFPPPARADHVLFSRSPPPGMRPFAATVRNSCCACVKN